MNRLALLLLLLCLTAPACRRRKAETTPTPEPIAPPTAAQTGGSTPPTTSTASATAVAPVNINQLEASVDFSDLNNLVAGFEYRNKRLPTLEELGRAYGRPLPVPPGYRLAIDPKSKTVKAVR